MGRIERITRLIKAAWTGETFLWLNPHDREKAACDLPDADLLKWSRWALATANRFYVDDAKRKERSLQEIVTMHGVISMALAVLKQNATRGQFIVNGATFRGEEKGDWQVTIEQIAPPYATKADSDGDEGA